MATTSIARRALLLALWCAAWPSGARDKGDEWLEIRSQHFVVATNGGEKQGRKIADQFERMRSMFHAAFPKLQMETGIPIVVLACRDEKSFRALEPEEYLVKGSLKLGGLFLRTEDKNYVLLRLDAEGDHPYAVVYHEYTHYLMGKSAEWLPLWMNEGLAEFYQNTDIHEKDVELGWPSRENLALLRQNRLLPLSTLLTVDVRSPYYHEESKGNIFYAESWALMHYLQVKDRQDNKDRLRTYDDLVAKGTDSVAAATEAFGDLQKLQTELEEYVERSSYTYFKMVVNIEVDQSQFQMRQMTDLQSDAMRADFLAYEKRTSDARTLVDHVLEEDPKNASAQETMGFLEFHAGHLDEAEKWYRQAVQSDSQSFLAHFLFASMALNRSSAAASDVTVESSLRTAIKLNPSFAPSYDRLGALLGMARRNLEEARRMELNAIALDPGNFGYRMNMANILMEMDDPQNAIKVLQVAAKTAKTPEQSEMAENMMRNAEMFAASKEERQKLQSSAPVGDVSTQPTVEISVPRLAREEHPFVAKGPHRFVNGTLKNVQCKVPELDLTVDTKGKTLALHSENSYKIDFTTLGFTLKGDLNPCKDLEGRPAKVEYVESEDATVTARVLSVELHK